MRKLFQVCKGYDKLEYGKNDFLIRSKLAKQILEDIKAIADEYEKYKYDIERSLPVADVTINDCKFMLADNSISIKIGSKVFVQKEPEHSVEGMFALLCNGIIWSFDLTGAIKIPIEIVAVRCERNTEIGFEYNGMVHAFKSNNNKSSRMCKILFFTKKCEIVSVHV